MKRILFIIPRLTSGGAERQAVTVAVLLKKTGYDVSFVCYSEGDFFESTLNEVGIPVTRKNCNYLRRILFVTHHIRRGRFDVVISFMPTPNFLNCFAAITGKKWKVITSERSSDESSITSRRGRLFAYFQKHADYIICNSDNARQIWLRHYPQHTSRLRTIYNAVSLTKDNTIYTPKRGNRTNIVVAATVYKIKNPLGVLKAIQQMTIEERSKIHVDWYGKAEDEIGNHAEYDKVVSYINTHGLHDYFSLHDATKQIAKKMGESDYVGLFSQLEGLPNAICEAMMIGKPILMTRCSDYSILVENDINGFLCEWNNPDSIKKALIKASETTPRRIIEMGNASRDKAINLFTPERILEQWISIIEG